jgi:hypothetical protein
MTSAKQLEANRRNAQVSTGPISEEGKAVASKNALTHGLRAAKNVVIKDIEDPREWEAHHAAVLESLQPIDFFETVLAERVAAQLWRLARATRYESELIEISQETVEDDLNERRRFMRGRPGETHPEDIRESLKDAKLLGRVLNRIPSLPDDAPMKPAETGRLLWSAGEVVNAELDWHSLLDIPKDEEPFEPEAVTGFTAGRVRKCLNEIANTEGISLEELMGDLTDHARFEKRVWSVRAAETEVEVHRMRKTRLLPLGQTNHQALQRYETMLERSVFRTLHELQRLQNKRQGDNVLCPVALDVDVSTGE